jgi:chorismate mutase
MSAARRSGRRLLDERATPHFSDIMPPSMRLFALRGANTVENNTSADILWSTEALMKEILQRNELTPDDVVSCIFTVTADLDADFPAVAARRLGFDQVPLMCAREIPVPGSLPKVVRVLMHYYADEGHRAKHVYLGEAQRLRRDLESAQ